ncbi:MAG: DUF1254 domain-containing protein [Myxococcota bacterium]
MHSHPSRAFPAALVLAVLALLVPVAPRAQEPASLTGDADEFRSIAEEAYLYAFPMLVAYKVLHDYNVDRDSGAFRAPFNRIARESRVYTPKDTAVSTPNSDTPYAFVQLDLRAEPMVLCVPEVEKERYYDVQLTDMYTFNYGYMGSRTTGNDAGCFLVSGPGWSGETPEGIEKAFQSETDFTFVVFRTQLFSPDDMPNVEKVQAGYAVKPLSAFLGTDPPPAAPAIEWPAFTKAAFGAGFPRYLNFLLQFAPVEGRATADRPLRQRFAKIGIGAGRPFDPAKLSDAQRSALAAGIQDANAKIAATAEGVGVSANGWRIGAAAGSRDFFGGNLALRAAGSKLGIYGNDAEEATYPFTRDDVNGVPLDGSKHAYTLTFPADAMPPTNAFWSVTMYDGETQLLIDNPIDRYLVNSPMLPGLKKNPDGSLTLHIRHDSPGKELESNWLPAPAGSMFVVMRLYWPRSEAPSVLPPGKGSWTPPGIVPVTNTRALRARRPGDKSLETVIRTDERYGADPVFQGPRGWPYWNLLEYAKPIQNPNLWPDTQSTYFLSQLSLPAGARMTLKGAFPQARYFKLALYRAEHGTFVSTGEALAAKDIEPDAGSGNPFRVGASRLASERDYTVHLLAEPAPEKTEERRPNTLYAGDDGAELQLILRIYLPDQGMDGAGWAPGASASARRGLPRYTGRLADGTQLSSEQVVARFAHPFTAATKQPLSAAQWSGLVNAKGNDPALDPATAPARESARWEKYWTFRRSIVGSFQTPEEQAKIPYQGAIDGGGDPATQYLFVQLSRKFGPVYVVQGRMPTFPDTFAGATGRGLATMPAAQTQYWSVVSCEAVPSGKIVDGVTDMQVPLDADRRYTLVYSRKEDRPRNATLENGVAWIEWSPRGEGIDGPTNREDFGMLMMRVMAPDADWAESPSNITEPGMEERVMGPYFPRGYYTDKKSFEKEGPR